MIGKTVKECRFKGIWSKYFLSFCFGGGGGGGGGGGLLGDGVVGCPLLPTFLNEYCEM